MTMSKHHQQQIDIKQQGVPQRGNEAILKRINRIEATPTVGDTMTRTTNDLNHRQSTKGAAKWPTTQQNEPHYKRNEAQAAANKITNPKEMLHHSANCKSNSLSPETDQPEVMIVGNSNSNSNYFYRQHAPSCLASKVPTQIDENEQHSHSHHNHSHHNHHKQQQQQPVDISPQANLLQHDHSHRVHLQRRHQPHCIYHHNPNCPNNRQPVKLANRREDDDLSSSDLIFIDSNNNHSKCKSSSANKYLKASSQQDKYLLVEYRPSGSSRSCSNSNSSNNSGHPSTRITHNHHHVHNHKLPTNTNSNYKFQRNTSGCSQDNHTNSSSDSNNNSNSNRTIKFISQLYFLLHLSAVLSLLLHHKNLVTSENDAQQSSTLTGVHLGRHQSSSSNQATTANGSLNQVPTTTTMIPAAQSDPLPTPLMQLSSYGHEYPKTKVISSFVATQSMSNGTAISRLRPSRQVAQNAPTQQQQSPAILLHNPDILVRLVGPVHARYALQYFLCYLLATSVLVLVYLRLIRLLKWRRRLTNGDGGRQQLEPRQNLAKRTLSSGFYYRTRLDCTPVLIGSISLGLVQLIVIGLDISNNIDWLTNPETRWPSNIPFLQFAFVSLLAQYILGKVAKKKEQRKSDLSTADEIESQVTATSDNNKSLVGCSNEMMSNSNQRLTATASSASVVSNSVFAASQSPLVANGNGKRFDAHNRMAFVTGNQLLPSAVVSYNNNNESNNNNGCCSGFENIALAHLLVTHILLWLMKLNSISLFEAGAIEHQQSSQRQQRQPQKTQQQQQEESSQPQQTPIQSMASGGSSRSLFVHSLYTNQPISAQVDKSLVAIATDAPQLDNWSSQRAPDRELDRGNLRLELATGSRAKSSLGSQQVISNFTTGRNPQVNLTDSKLRLNEPSLSPVTLPPPTTTREPEVTSTHLPEATQSPPPTATSSTTTTTTTTSTTTTNKPIGNNQIEPRSSKNERSPANNQMDSSKTRRAHHSQADASLLVPVLPQQSSKFPVNQQAGNSNQVSPIKGGSPIPKRMTAFRQSRPRQPAPSAASAPAPVQEPPIRYLNPNVNSNLIPNLNPNPKRPVRLLIQRVEDPVGSSDLADELNQRRRRAKQSRVSEGLPVSSSSPLPPLSSTRSRPFPSVDPSPAPIGRSTTFASIRLLNNRTLGPPFSIGPLTSTGRAPLGLRGGRTGSHRLALDPIVTTTIPTSTFTLLETTTIEPPEVEVGTSTSGSVEDLEEITDADLEAMLPPVPNFSEERSGEDDTTTTEESTIISSRRSSSNQQPAITKVNNNKTNLSKVAQLLDEDPFAFKEAASEIKGTNIAPPIGYNLITKTAPVNIIHRVPMAEALVMPQQQQHQPTFADYLMPIVNQYHILIVAILFNMWLDGLRSSSKGLDRKSSSSPSVNSASQCNNHLFIANQNENISFSNHRLISSSRHLLLAPTNHHQQPPPTNSSTGSDDSASSQNRLLVIPVAHRKHQQPANNHHSRRQQHNSLQPTAFERVDKTSGRWQQHGGCHKHHSHRHQSQYHISGRQQTHRSRSMDSLLHRPEPALIELPNESPVSTSCSSLSRHNSLDRCSSSERLLWVPSARLRLGLNKSPLLSRRLLAPFPPSCSAAQRRGHHKCKQQQQPYRTNILHNNNNRQRPSWHQQPAAATSTSAFKRRHPANSVCSVFLGLVVVSVSLIVILVGIDLLSLITQCAAQLVSIGACLLGLCLIWRLRLKSRSRLRVAASSGQLNYRRRLLHLTATNRKQLPCVTVTGHKNRPLEATCEQQQSHRQCFHYLFLLAAYYCGISIALNLSKQHSVQQLFSHQVLQFIQRHLSPTRTGSFLSSQQIRPEQLLAASIANYLFLFHLVLAIKGLLLIVQVTLQTVLIRSSCQQATAKLRQIYTFLVFANLSLWAMEICEQQQHLQRSTDLVGPIDTEHPAAGFRLISLDSFTRFAASIVTLSHLYHGLVFMQP